MNISGLQMQKADRGRHSLC